jgi:hypothetical protein
MHSKPPISFDGKDRVVPSNRFQVHSIVHPQAVVEEFFAMDEKENRLLSGGAARS